MTVYKHYSQEQLNDQYNIRQQIPQYAEYFEKWKKQSEQVDKSYAWHKDIFFGNHSQECLDIFPAKKPLAKTMIFIHGGYWHLLDKALFHFLAPPFLSHNVNIVFINYLLAPDASMDMIVSSCHRAIQWLHENVVGYNGNPMEMYLMGHSAGGHLATMILTAQHTNYLKGVISISGLFRLEPVMLSFLNRTLLMNVETADKNSPVLIESLNKCPITLAIGINETDEFKEQSLEFYNRWSSERRDMELLFIKDRNHYSILDEITEKDSTLLSAIFRMMDNGYRT